MPDRSVLAEKVQWGLETVEGTAVPADKLFRAMGINFEPQATIDRFRAMGLNWPAISILLRESTAGSLEGRPDFNEIVYPLNSAISTGVITTPGGGTLSRTHTHTLKSSGSDARKSFTIEKGTDDFAEKSAGVVLPDFNLSVSPDGLEVGGAVLGRALTKGITLTATPTAIVQQIMTPLLFNVYIDSTSGALGTTKLTRAFEANFGVSGRWSQFYVIDRLLAGSPAATIQAEADSACDLVVQADTTGLALFDAMRAGSTQYVRIEAIGAVIEAAITYKLLIDMAVQVGDAPSFDEREGVRAITWPLRLTADSAWGTGQAAVIAVTNKVVTL